MDNVIDAFLNHVVLNIKTIRDAAANYNGACKWHFSQAKDPVRTVISKNKRTKNGICEILAAKWITEGYRQGSLRSWLAGASEGRQGMDVAKISLLAQTFGTAIINGDDAEEHQAKCTEHWLRSHDVRPRDYEDSEGFWVGGTKFNPEEDLLATLRRRVNRETRFPLYALITVGERHRLLGALGHIMAVKVGPINGADILYFDPNYGEFAFNGWNGFKDWFNYYWRKSHYQQFMGTYWRLRYF
jgi:hypothetical protein